MNSTTDRMGEGGGNNVDDDDDDLFTIFSTPISSASAVTALPGTKDVKELSGTAELLLPHGVGGVTQKQHTNVDISSNVPLMGFEGSRSPNEVPPSSDPFMSIVSSMSMTGGVGGDEEKGDWHNKTRPAIIKEPNSGIRVSRPTRICEQLSIVFAQHPFVCFKQMRASLADSGVHPTSLYTVVGVVIRKTDPKQRTGKHAYGVIGLWNMHGPSSTPSEELSILLTGSAFDTHYTKIVTGVVLAITGLQRMEGRSGASMASCAVGAGVGASGVSQNSPGSSELLKLSKGEQLRVLGFAVDIGSCQGIHQRTGERCANLVNAAVSKYCAHHASNIRQEARGVSRSTLKQASMHASGSPFPGTSFAPAAARTGSLSTNFAAIHTGATVVSRASLQALRRGQQGFLTVKGSSGLPVSSPGMSDVTSAGGAYASVVAGEVLPVTSVSINAARLLAKESNGSIGCKNNHANVGSYSPAVLGVTGRGRVVLGAAAEQEKAREHRRLVRLALQSGELSTKHERERDETDECAAVRRQYAPLPRDHKSNAFIPMRGSGSSDAVLIRGVDYKKRVVAQKGNGMQNAIVAAVEVKLRSEGVLAKCKEAARERRKELEDRACSSSVADSSSKPSSLLGLVAESCSSRHDELRTIEEERRLEQRMEQRLNQDKALEALKEIREQNVKALYCRQCDRWYMRRNERCKSLKHTLEARETVRRFIECEHCGYKTGVLGELRPSKLIPRCPRCCADAQWRESNAAPENAIVSLREVNV
ncbi:hypothetical protein TRVL_03724 [Trypanosoma vivax]|uniref:Replication factor Mcm10 C-terminal domain-containing protein n=1 Tax=Trypanosoma vivax (strain Y486) TaxID=1055687 RepID=G0U1R1_TRYVY|nr:hypothetical protein TRVL_03724 [Trypanosoma vivax]CCC50208.1 conserved hypothetical protein [Trypanosoma vivax Y486]